MNNTYPTPSAPPLNNVTYPTPSAPPFDVFCDGEDDFEYDSELSNNFRYFKYFGEKITEFIRDNPYEGNIDKYVESALFFYMIKLFNYINNDKKNDFNMNGFDSRFEYFEHIFNFLYGIHLPEFNYHYLEFENNQFFNQKYVDKYGIHNMLNIVKLLKDKYMTIISNKKEFTEIPAEHKNIHCISMHGVCTNHIKIVPRGSIIMFTSPVNYSITDYYNIFLNNSSVYTISNMINDLLSEYINIKKQKGENNLENIVKEFMNDFSNNIGNFHKYNQLFETNKIYYPGQPYPDVELSSSDVIPLLYYTPINLDICKKYSNFDDSNNDQYIIKNVSAKFEFYNNDNVIEGIDIKRTNRLAFHNINEFRDKDLNSPEQPVNDRITLSTLIDPDNDPNITLKTNVDEPVQITRTGIYIVLCCRNIFSLNDTLATQINLTENLADTTNTIIDNIKPVNSDMIKALKKLQKKIDKKEDAKCFIKKKLYKLGENKNTINNIFSIFIRLINIDENYMKTTINIINNNMLKLKQGSSINTGENVGKTNVLTKLKLTILIDIIILYVYIYNSIITVIKPMCLLSLNNSEDLLKKIDELLNNKNIDLFNKENTDEKTNVFNIYDFTYIFWNLMENLSKDDNLNVDKLKILEKYINIDLLLKLNNDELEIYINNLILFINEALSIINLHVDNISQIINSPNKMYVSEKKIIYDFIYQYLTTPNELLYYIHYISQIYQNMVNYKNSSNYFMPIAFLLYTRIMQIITDTISEYNFFKITYSPYVHLIYNLHRKDRIFNINSTSNNLNKTKTIINTTTAPDSYNMTNITKKKKEEARKNISTIVNNNTGIKISKKIKELQKKCSKLNNNRHKYPNNPNIKILYEGCNAKLQGLTEKLKNLV